MTETTSYKFVRKNEDFPDLKDVELQIELSPEEIQLVEEIKSLEDRKEMSEGFMGGSGRVREYKMDYRVPYGYELEKPRKELDVKFKRSRDFISEHMEGVKKQSSPCAPIMDDIKTRLDQLLE